MDRDFWLERWRTRQIGFHQEDFHPALLRHWADLKVPSGAPVLVPLCGKSRDMAWLRQQGHPVIGVELSPLAARAFFAESGLEPLVSQQGRFERWEAEGVAILCGDVFDLAAADIPGVAAAYDRAALVALPPELRARYTAKLREVLPPGAPTLLVTFEYDQRAMDGPPFSVPEDEVRRLYAGATVEHVLTRDVLDTEPRWRERGLTRISEHVFLVHA